MKIKEINRTSTIAWSHDVIPLLAMASAAGAVDLNFSSASSLEIWDPFGPQSNTPIFTAHVDHKFHALAWSSPFDGYSHGVLVAALETGVVEFYNVETLIKKGSLQSATVHSSTKHSGAVKSLSFNPLQPHILASGGSHGQIYVWDLKTFAEPFIPGRPMTPMDEISCVAWNNTVPHIMASTSNAGYTSIWDLKSKREVLHLSYNGALGRADFSHVAWHPTQSTKLITCSQSDSCPIIMSWDLRNASEPEVILQGHTKGVLSLDWCVQDPNLLISSGKDNTTKLWNPITGVKLGEYPSAANWAFLTRFAPRAPDVIATASFDAKIIIQTLQDTSPPVSETVRSNNDDEFWSNIATAEVQQAVFEVQQAPAWLKRPCSASFGFGSKLVTVTNTNGKGSVSVAKFLSKSPANEALSDLQDAIKANDYSKIVAAKLASSASDRSDWEVLQKLQDQGKGSLFKSNEEDEHSETAQTDEVEDLDPENEDAFFTSLSKDVKDKKAQDAVTYVPTGNFKIINDADSAVESRLAKLLLNYKISDAVTLCLEEGKLTEALILALDQSDAIRNKVKNHYFSQSGSNVTSRLIYSASSKDISDIVANADISDWRDIGASVASFCKDEEDFNHRMVELGDRLMQGSASKENRDNAFMCYLAGNALDKVSAIWLGDLPELEKTLLKNEAERISSPLDARYLALAGFVEKLSVYRSISKISGPLGGPAIEPVGKAIFEFSNMAASSGFFELADQFMAILPDDLAGLKTEKDRIAKASGSRKASVHNAQNGHSVRAGRYSLGHKTALAAPSLPTNPRAEPSTAIPPLQAYAPNGATNPYVPAVSAPAPAFNPYNPNPAEKRSSVSGIQTPVAPIGVVRPPSTPAFTQPGVQPSIYGNPAQAAPPPPSAKKNDTDGWNDLPDTFKATKPAARRTPAPALGSGFVSSPSKPMAPMAKLPPSRVSSQSQPPVAGHPSQPPPLSRLPSSQIQPPPPKKPTPKTNAPGTPGSNKYAPEAASPTGSATGSINGHTSGQNVHPGPPKSAPKNPYAPTATTSAKTTYAAPPQNTFVAPVASRPVANPYTPPPSSSASFGPRRPGHGRTISTSSTGPKAPPVMDSPSFAPPTRPVGSRRGSHTSNPYQPKASPHVPGTEMTAPIGPPGGLGIAPPPTRPVAGNGPAAPGPHVPPPGVNDPAGRSRQATPGPYAPNGAQNAVNQYAPPVGQSGVPNQYAPPIRPVNAYAPSGTSTPPAAMAPPPVAPAAPPLAPPVARPVARPIAPPIAPPTARPTSAAPVAPPVARPAPPTSAAPPVSQNPVGPPKSSGPPVSSAHRTMSVSPQTGPVQGSSIEKSFSTILAQIKPEAPPKYAKHVADMEKRLNILFGDLSGAKVSGGAVELLEKVASSLDSKDFASAAAANQDISASYAAEAGNWLTGVKRLVTMAEAFSS